jgi:glucose/arabinose dehydrogenase
MSVRLRIVQAILASVLAAGAAAAADRPALELGKEVARVAAPAFIIHAGDGSGRVFAGERGGRIVVFDGELPRQQIFLDIAARVNLPGGGLRAAVFPYDFADKRSLYVSYVGKEKDLVVSRFRLVQGGDAADPATETVLLRVPQAGGERPGGGLAFGPDGKLCVGVGEGTAARKSRGDAQSLASLRGKILRIDVESSAKPYGVPVDNPFVKIAGARPEIWARGLGSPSWLAFDPRTGDLVVTDALGARHEEINVLPGTSMGGENYGWDVLDGTACRAKEPCDKAGFAMPAAVFPRSKGCELGPGVIARGGPYPEIEGDYVLGNDCSTRLRGVRRTEAGGWESRDLFDAGIRLSAVGAGENGVLFVADRRTGKVYEVRPATHSGGTR